MNYYSPECYFKNPETLEEGWEIKFPTVKANSKKEAANMIKKLPFFDCFIDHSFDKYN